MVLILIDTRSLYKNRYQNEYNILILKLILSAEINFYNLFRNGDNVLLKLKFKMKSISKLK